MKKTLLTIAAIATISTNAMAEGTGTYEDPYKGWKNVPSNMFKLASGEDYKFIKASGKMGFSAMIDYCDKFGTPEDELNVAKLKAHSDPEKIKAIFLPNMKDPESVKFEGIYEPHSRTVCTATTPHLRSDMKDVWVKTWMGKSKEPVHVVETGTWKKSKPIAVVLANGKNSYGGYVGVKASPNILYIKDHYFNSR